MTTELYYLTLVAGLTGLLWLPYVLNRIAIWGLLDTVGYPANPKPLAPWAQRLRAAHANAVENLVVFAPLVLVAHVAGVNTAVTAQACVLYFWARAVHALAYSLALPWLRTAAFFAGVAAQLMVLWQLLV